MKWLPINGFTYADLEKSSEDLFNEFIRTFGFDLYVRDPAPKSFKKFMQGDKSYNSGTGEREIPPGRDHAIAFKKSGTNLIMYVFHPYHFDKEKEEALSNWCRDRNLDYAVLPEASSFYYVGGTKMVMVRSAGTKWYK